MKITFGRGAADGQGVVVSVRGGRPISVWFSALAAAVGGCPPLMRTPQAAVLLPGGLATSDFDDDRKVVV